MYDNIQTNKNLQRFRLSKNLYIYVSIKKQIFHAPFVPKMYVMILFGMITMKNFALVSYFY